MSLPVLTRSEPSTFPGGVRKRLSAQEGPDKPQNKQPVMPLETATALDIESLNKPDDSAHGVYNATTLKNADDIDDDGHVKRTGTHV